MSDEIIEALAAARPPQFRPGSAIDPATRQRELTAAFSAPARSSRHRRHRRGRRPDRLPLTVVAAVSAALSIALIAAGVYLLHSSSPGPRPPKPVTSKHPVKKPVPPPVHNLLSAPVAKPPPVTRAQAGMPAYYVVADHNGPAIEVRSTTTGELLSSVTLPAGVDPKLCEIAKGPDGQFVLALFALPRTSFYRLKVSDRGLSAQLSKLPVPSIKIGRYVEAVALTPDGAKLAFALQIPNKQGSSERGAIEVVTLATGSTRTWTSTHVGYPVQLSWTDHGRDLGFFWQDDGSGSQPAAGLWKLDPTAPGRDLFSGRHVLPGMVGLDEVQSAAFSPDGKTIDASVYKIIFHKIRRGVVVGGIVKLSAETGRPLSTLLIERAPHASKYGNRSPSTGECVLIAADAAANHLLLNCATQFGRLDHGRFTVMPNPDPGVFLAVAW
jgi:hypothetical protein